MGTLNPGEASSLVKHVFVLNPFFFHFNGMRRLESVLYFQLAPERYTNKSLSP